ncbi:MAG: hypothetical protein JSW45_01100 [Thiotrichales bacterium]|nr:MAG: hypothetical protein JSW45_01100 [Thiotrichales bacterium]
MPTKPNQHISQKFDEEMEDLRNDVMKMGGFVEQQMRRVTVAFRQLDVEEAETVVRNDHYINGLEGSIDEECTRILLRRQPAATDLRMVVAVIKTLTDLERIGDHVMHIGEYVIYLVMAKDIRHLSIEEAERDVVT